MDTAPARNDTLDIYERLAAEYDAARSTALFEAKWLARFTRDLPVDGHVLDLGCGTGQPIAQWFANEGFRVTGLDFAEAMLNIARERQPDGDWRHGDMRHLDLPEQFDGIIAWNSFNHLTQDEQTACIARIARHLKLGGSFLTTVGPRAGTATGTIAGQKVRHASLSPAGYAACFEDNGMRLTGLLVEDPDTMLHSVLMARKDI
ncbi:MAG: class I SAM-dependent methyltransferase [Rhodobacteraceae bacterium]|nr:class I SAM-dependent methyltransferase [Paracoccaceae bacterium]